MSKLKLVIPSETNVPPESLFAYTTMVYGEKGIGKTSLLAQFPNCLVFMFEPRRRNLKIRQVWQNEDESGPLDWATFKAYAEMLIEQGPEESGVDTLAVDSLDRAYQRCLEHICSEAGIVHPNDANDYGKTWDKIKKEVENTLVDLSQAGYGVTLTSHAKMKRVTPPMGDSYDQMNITAPEAPSNIAKALCDFVVYYGYVGTTRAFTVRGTQAIYAACGVEDRFLDPEGRKLLTIDAGTAPQDAYQHLVDGFNNKLRGIVWTPPESVCESFEYQQSLPDVPDTTNKGTVKRVLAKSK